MTNSFNLSDLGIKIFTYAEYCGKLDASAVLNNAAIGKIAAPFWNQENSRRYVSPDMVHCALFQVNPDLYLLHDEIEFADVKQRDAVTRLVNQQLHKIKGYRDELRAYERKCKAPNKAVRKSIKYPSVHSDIKRSLTPVVKEIAYKLLQTTSLNCLPEAFISVSDENINLTMLHMHDLKISQN